MRLTYAPLVIHFKTRFTLGQMSTQLLPSFNFHLQLALQSHVFLANLTLLFRKLHHFLFV